MGDKTLVKKSAVVMPKAEQVRIIKKELQEKFGLKGVKLSVKFDRGTAARWLDVTGDFDEWTARCIESYLEARDWAGFSVGRSYGLDYGEDQGPSVSVQRIVGSDSKGRVLTGRPLVKSVEELDAQRAALEQRLARR